MVAPQNFVGALKNWNFPNNYIIYSQTSFNGHISITATKIPYIDRVRKYAKFGVFYAKIVQMTPQRLRRESL